MATTERDGSTLTVRISGDLDCYSVPDVRARVSAALAVERTDRLVVGLGGVSFLDTTGLGLLIGYRNECHDAGRDLLLRDVTPRIRRLLELTGLEGSFRYCSDDPSAA